MESSHLPRLGLVDAWARVLKERQGLKGLDEHLEV